MRHITTCLAALALFAGNALAAVHLPASRLKVVTTQGETADLQWREVKTSFTEKGYHTYVGTMSGARCATATMAPDGEIGGWLYDADGSATQLRAVAGGRLTPTGLKVATPALEEVPEATYPADIAALATKRLSAISAEGTSELVDDVSLVYNDDRIHIYRTALPVDYTSYKYYCSGTVSGVRTFWAQTEAMLNEILGKQAGVYFQVIDNEDLIMTTSDAKYPTSTSSYTIINYGTSWVDELIGEDAYDFGCFIAYLSDNNGLSKMAAAAYMKNYRGGCTSVATPLTVVHEASHMFGTVHTNADDNGTSYMSEPGSGSSVMTSAYKAGRFLSLLSLNRIRRYAVGADMSYYLWPERTELVQGANKFPGSSYNNYAFALPSDNRPPVINREKTLTAYTIPSGSLFQFDIDATDPDGDELEYAAQQINYNKKSTAIFRTLEPQSASVVEFKPMYEYSIVDRKWSKLEGTDVSAVGTYYFWVGVNDVSPYPDDFLTHPHAVGYDIVECKVTFVDGTPFKITSPKATTYTAGQRLTLNWGVDTDVFPADSKVRILLSDDFGQTYNYVLKASAPNNGECEVILPPDLTIGQVSYLDSGRKIRGGVIKIEVIDNIAYALTECSPVTEGYNNDFYEAGGFTLTTSPITFTNLPERYVEIENEYSLPDVADVKAYAGTTELQVTYTQKRDDDKVFSRVWEATDGSGNKSAFEQLIVIKDFVPTGIGSATTAQPASDARGTYDLQGRRADKVSTRGIYIVDGKKQLK